MGTPAPHALPQPCPPAWNTATTTAGPSSNPAQHWPLPLSSVPTCPSLCIPSPSLTPPQGDCRAARRCLNRHEMEAFTEMTFSPAWGAYPPFKENQYRSCPGVPRLIVSGWQPPALTAAINLRKEPSRPQPPHREGPGRVLGCCGDTAAEGTAQGGCGGVTHRAPRLRGAGSPRRGCQVPALCSAAGPRQEQSSAVPVRLRGCPGPEGQARPGGA